MSLVAPYSPNGQVASQAGMKPFAVRRRRLAVPTDPETDSVLRVKWNPDWEQGTTPGLKVVSATVEVGAVNIELRINGPVARSIAWAGKTAQQLVDEINAPMADGSRYWRAGLGDNQPENVNSLDTLAPENILLGYNDSVALKHSHNFLVYASNGYDESGKGVGDFQPQPYDMDYNYPIQTAAGTPPSTVGRGGGISARQGEDILPQKASRFGTNNIRLAKERHPANTVFETIVQSVGHDLTFGIAEPVRIAIYQGGGMGLVWATILNIGETEIVVPDVKVRGPAYVAAQGTGAAAITGGGLNVRGLQRVA